MAAVLDRISGRKLIAGCVCNFGGVWELGVADGDHTWPPRCGCWELAFQAKSVGEMRTGKKILSSLVIAAATTVTITGTIKTKVLLSE